MLISVSVTAEYDLREDDLWPDGDAPDDWDAKDVLEAIEGIGYERIGLYHDLEVDVAVLDASEGKSKYA